MFFLGFWLFPQSWWYIECISPMPHVIYSNQTHIGCSCFLCLVYDCLLVGGLEHFLFFHRLGIVIPTDKYFSEGLKPPTSLMFSPLKTTLWFIPLSKFTFPWFLGELMIRSLHLKEVSGVATARLSNTWNPNRTGNQFVMEKLLGFQKSYLVVHPT